MMEILQPHLLPLTLTLTLNLQRLNVDNEFVNLTDECHSIGIHLNIAAANEHVPPIERKITVIKEQARAIRHTPPYNRMPKTLVVELIKYVVFRLNPFPIKGGVSDKLSPRTLLTGLQIDFKLHCCLPFGYYVQTHEENYPYQWAPSKNFGRHLSWPR